MPLVPGRTFTELMFGFDTLIIIRIGEESRGNTNVSSSWPVFWPAKRPGCSRVLVLFYMLNLDFDNTNLVSMLCYYADQVIGIYPSSRGIIVRMDAYQFKEFGIQI